MREAAALAGCECHRSFGKEGDRPCYRVVGPAGDIDIAAACLRSLLDELPPELALSSRIPLPGNKVATALARRVEARGQIAFVGDVGRARVTVDEPAKAARITVLRWGSDPAGALAAVEAAVRAAVGELHAGAAS